MPGDPKSVVDTRLARTADDRDRFLSLQMMWIRLAAELDRMGALIEAAQELEERQPIKAAEQVSHTTADAFGTLDPVPG